MSFSGDIRHTPGCGDPRVPLMNLSGVQARMDNLQKFLSDSVNSNTLLSQPQMDMVSSEITSAIHQIIVNGSALLTSNQPEKMAKPKVEIHVDDEVEDYDIIEMDAVELLAEHVHFCEICGKGFKRDANLRMHMRAHGNQFKTPEALAKPEKAAAAASRGTRFSCPYVGCNRNKQHKKFRPLKSAICVKNHFKRSHCPKMYTCTRCNLKSFSVVTDLKSHLKHCGESKWRCSCGTTFSRKDKLFGHMELFEGHMPAVVNEVEEKGKSAAVAAAVEEDEGVNVKNLEIGNGFFEGLLDEFDSIENYCFRDVNTCGSMEGLFNF